MSFTYIADASLTSAGTITFSNIPQTYTDLKLIVYGKSIASGESTTMRFNGSTSSIYNYAGIYNNSGGANSTDVSRNLTYCTMGALSSWATAMYEIDIFQYANSTDYKQARNTFTEWTNSTNSGRTGIVTHMWFSTAAITSITLAGGTASTLGSGTKASLYGITKA